ncbi:MAG: PrsW family intramembrane metalloprotease [Oscillospiraceae bacterium]|nr:PrsW family intramembrane metalloprotease [Oscillospiraceae bacterium]
MLFYFLPAIRTYNLILIAAAVIPAVFLMVRVYRTDRLEKEPRSMLLSLVFLGVLSSVIAMIAERLSCAVLDRALPRGGVWYNVILYFGIVAFEEEGAKYLLLSRRTRRSAEFDCLYDGVVYAVFVSLGFALAENIGYVMVYGFHTALIRAVTAIPGHACFGVFMGAFYSFSEKSSRRGDTGPAALFRILAVVIPALLHGAYDYTAAVIGIARYFIALIAVIFLAAYALIGRMSRNDGYI